MHGTMSSSYPESQRVSLVSPSFLRGKLCRLASGINTQIVNYIITLTLVGPLIMAGEAERIWRSQDLSVSPAHSIITL